MRRRTGSRTRPTRSASQALSTVVTCVAFTTDVRSRPLSFGVRTTLPAGFLFVFSLRVPATLVYVPLALFLGGVLALGFRDFWRPHRKEPVTWGCRRTGIRIPEDDT